MEKLTITKIYRSKTKKDGSPLIKKDGTPWERVVIKTQEKGDMYISFFGSKTTDTWSEGTVIDCDIVKSGDFFNGKLPGKFVGREEFDALVNKVTELANMVKQPTHIEPDEILPVDEEDDSEIPF